MEVRASGRYLRVSPSKARRVVDLIRMKDCQEAEASLDHLAGPTAGMVKKVLASARANAEHNYELERDNLFVAKAFVDPGPTLKRFRARARGRANRIRKRTCHVTIILADRQEE
jgi:large subunit ribosomal protein L22